MRDVRHAVSGVGDAARGVSDRAGPAGFVPEAGQQWTTLDELRGSHRAEIREELPGLLGIGCKPGFAINQATASFPRTRATSSGTARR